MIRFEILISAPSIAVHYCKSVIFRLIDLYKSVYITSNVLVGGTTVVPESVRTRLTSAGYRGTFIRPNGTEASHTNQLAIQWMVGIEDYS